MIQDRDSKRESLAQVTPTAIQKIATTVFIIPTYYFLLTSAYETLHHNSGSLERQILTGSSDLNSPEWSHYDST